MAAPAHAPGLVWAALPSGFGAQTLAADGNGLLLAGTVGAQQRCATVAVTAATMQASAPVVASPPTGADEVTQPCAREVTVDIWLVVRFKDMGAVTLALATRSALTAPLRLGPVVATLKGNWGLAHDGDVVAANGLVWVYDDGTKPMSVVRVSAATGRAEGRFPVPGLGYDPLMAADDDGLWIGPSQGWGGGKGARLYRIGPEAKRPTVARLFNGALQWLDASGYRLWAGVVSPSPRLSESVWLLDGTGARRVFSTPAPGLPGPEVAYAMVGDLAQGLYTLDGDLSAPVDSDDCAGHLDVVEVDPGTGAQRVVGRMSVRSPIPWVPCGWNSLGNSQAAIVGHDLYFLWDVSPLSEGGYTRLYELPLGHVGDGAPRRAPRGIGPARTTGLVTVTPKEPQALAVAPDGTLFVVDTGRDQVLRLVAGGRFVVVAGDGRRGFSGNGGPALDAELRLSGASGVAVSPSGTVYFSDTGNGRVRAVLPDGEIETVAGGGHQALPARPGTEIAALSAALGPAGGLTFGPGHQLYVAANFIVRLSPAGTLAWVAGSRSGGPGVCGPTSCAVRQENFDGASGLAFEGNGTLVVASSNFPGAGFALGLVRPDGHVGDLGAMRGEGGRAPAISSGPEGSVICAGQIGFYRLADGSQALGPIANAGAFDRALGEPFFGGDGVAVSPSGQIYADTSPLANQTPNAIAELFPSGQAQVIWKS
jgi:hypothetical protein